MRTRARGFWAAPYVVAIFLILAATVLRLAFLQSLGTSVVFITFYPAVMLAALYGGLLPGMLAALLSVVAADYLWIEPAGSLFINRSQDWLAVAVFVSNCALMSWVAGKLRQSNSRVRQIQDSQRRELEEQVAERTALLHASEERLAAALQHRADGIRLVSESGRARREGALA